jgi:hypothetical protein
VNGTKISARKKDFRAWNLIDIGFGDSTNRTEDIGLDATQASLKLFHVNNNTLNFTNAIGETGLDVTPDFPYANTLREKITLVLESARGHCPSPHRIQHQEREIFLHAFSITVFQLFFYPLRRCLL